MKLSAITIFLCLFLSKYSKAQHMQLFDRYKLLSIDAVGPYYKLLMEGHIKGKDTITVLSLIRPLNKAAKSHQWKLLKPGKEYLLKLESMREVRVSDDTNVVALINLRSFAIGDKELLKPDKLPYCSANIYQLYYIPMKRE